MWISSNFICTVRALIRTWPAFVVRAVTRDDLSAADRAPFYIASRHVKSALDHATIMASLLIGSPIVVLVTVPNSPNISPSNCVGRTLLGREYLFRPSLNHRSATILDALRFAHSRNQIHSVPESAPRADSKSPGNIPSLTGARISSPHFFKNFLQFSSFLAQISIARFPASRLSPFPARSWSEAGDGLASSSCFFSNTCCKQ
jgi:hypothetical protein